MFFLDPTLAILLVSLCNAAERPNSHRITLAPRAINTSTPTTALATSAVNNTSIATVTLAPATNFNQSLPAGVSVNVTGPQIELIANIPTLNGDALFALGPDAVEALDLAYQENCPNGLDSPNCEAGLQNAINVDQQALQKRVVIFLVPIMVAAIAVEYAQIRKYESGISTIRMPSPNLERISSAQGASTVVFATQPNGGNLITAVPSPTVVSTSQFAVATVTADSSVAQTGDLVFGMSAMAGYAFSDFVQSYGHCTVTRKRSCDPYEQAGAVAAAAIGQVEPGGVMQDLIWLPTDISFPQLIQPLLAQLPLVIAFGKKVTLLAANSDLLSNVATFLLLAAFAELTLLAPNPTSLIVPASYFITSSPAPQPTASARPCPGQLPNCSNCGGNSVPQTTPPTINGTCIGLPQHNNFAAGCPCVDPNDAPVWAVYNNTADYNADFYFLAALAANLVNSTYDPTYQSISTTSTTSATPTSSSSAAMICINGAGYTALASCEAKCVSGTCSALVVKGKRSSEHTSYKCTCS